MTILNEIESTGEAELTKVEGELSSAGTTIAEGEAVLKEVVSTAETVIAEPAHILEQAHSFFDLCKTKLENVVAEVIKHAESTEEAIEAAILTAIGHATNETNNVGGEVQSS